jgi:epsin
LDFLPKNEPLNTTTFRYVGLSSSGITYKSGSASYGSSSYQSSDWRGSGTRDGDRFKDSYKDRDQYGEDKYEKDTYGKSSRGAMSENQGNGLKKGSTRNGRYGVYICS